MIIIDEYSRFPFTYSCPDLSINTVIKRLTDVFSLCTDHGTSFVSSELREFLNSEGVATSYSSPFNSCGNGQVQRLNGTLWQAIQLPLRDSKQPIMKWEFVPLQAFHSIISLLCMYVNK